MSGLLRSHHARPYTEFPAGPTKTASAADPTKPPSDPDFCAAYFQKLRQTRH
jgi:hypothetical protein